jgi:hypothetical protein
VLRGLQPGTELAGAVVENQRVVAALPVLAVADFLGLEAGQYGVVRMVAAAASEPGGGVAGGDACALCDLVALRIVHAASVVQAADHDRAVDVAFQITGASESQCLEPGRRLPHE